ncbi:cohesin subunit SA-3 [Striga asiatica]|uniref:Cohesin subunit SA-3 n=1 Tax=Striga asiatica TaxID=4170 RepID=A0A5A7R6T9_STRAF|nr:cohesin subunit SA-3 [Striga asiatica]
MKSVRQQRIHNLANKEHNTTGLLPYYKEERMVSYKVKQGHGLDVHRTSNHVDTSRSCCSLRALFVHLYVCFMKKERDFDLKIEAYFKLGETKIPHFHSFTWRVVLYEPRNRAEFLNERLQAIPGIGKKEVHGECPRVLTLLNLKIVKGERELVLGAGHEGDTDRTSVQEEKVASAFAMMSLVILVTEPDGSRSFIRPFVFFSAQAFTASLATLD